MKATNPQHGLKRKRSESENLLGDESKVPGKLHHGLKEIRKAAKKAKIFETQKLVKKLKNLRKDASKSSDVAEHEAQLNILKTIEHELLANTATKTKILKDRVLSQHEQTREALSREIGDNLLPTATRNTPAAKLHSRLLSSKILAAEISSLCDDLRKLFGHEPKKARIEVDEAGKLNTHQAIGSLTSPKANSRNTHSHVDSESEDEEGDVEETGWESGTVEEDHNADGWESGSISPVEGGSGVSRSEREGDGDGDDDDDDRTPHIASNKSSRNTTKQPDATSTFLPSLSVGFIRGSDESDWSDSEARIVDSGKKKNRRGQRARRAIWEKKYGKNANHKKKELEAQNNQFHKDGGRHKREHSHRGPLPKLAKQNNINDRGKQEKPDQRGSARLEISRQRNPTETKSRPLHPSWEAKRKLKEKQSAGIIPSQGTKIKFSD